MSQQPSVLLFVFAVLLFCYFPFEVNFTQIPESNSVGSTSQDQKSEIAFVLLQNTSQLLESVILHYVANS